MNSCGKSFSNKTLFTKKQTNTGAKAMHYSWLSTGVKNRWRKWYYCVTNSTQIDTVYISEGFIFFNWVYFDCFQLILCTVSLYLAFVPVLYWDQVITLWSCRFEVNSEIPCVHNSLFWIKIKQRCQEKFHRAFNMLWERAKAKDKD